MAVGDVWSAVISFQTGSVPTLINPFFREEVSVTPPAGILASRVIAEAIHVSDWMEALLATISEDVELLSIYTRRVLPAPDVPYLFVIGTNLPNVGSGGVAACPSQAAMLVTLYTALISRSGRGRMYIPGCPDGGNSEGLLTAAQLAELQTFADQVIEPIVMVPTATGEIRQVVYSRELNTADLVLAAVANSNMATIRGRRQRPGTA